MSLDDLGLEPFTLISASGLEGHQQCVVDGRTTVHGGLGGETAPGVLAELERLSSGRPYLWCSQNDTPSVAREENQNRTVPKGSARRRIPVPRVRLRLNRPPHFTVHGPRGNQAGLSQGRLGIGAENVGCLDHLVGRAQRALADQHRHPLAGVEHHGGAGEVFLSRHDTRA